MPRIQRLGIAAVMAAVMLVGGAPAFATEPLTPSSYVTDSDSFLSDEQRAKLETDAESLNSKYHVPVYTVIVPNFSDQEPAAWCRATLANIQNNDKVLIDSVQSAIYNAIPLWKNQMVIALGLTNQRKVLSMQHSVNEMTNDLLKKNAEMLKVGTIETTKENERSIVDIETVRKVNDDLVTTIETTLKIQQEGREKRRAAEAELVALEGRLKKALESTLDGRNG